MLKENSELINCQEAGGYCALHFAASTGNCSFIRFLCSNGADVNLENCDGNPPVIIAIRCRQMGSLQELISAGADLQWRSSSGASVSHYAASEGNLQFLDLLVQHGAPTSFEKCKAGSLLHWACHSSSVECVGTILYKYKVDVNAEDEHGGTPLLTAIFMKAKELAEFLLDNGANPNVQVKEDGTTPLHIAADLGLNDTVRTLCYAGADRQKKNTEGKTPQDIATEGGKVLVVKELVKEPLTAEQIESETTRLKLQGNKCFEKREFVKAIKFYSLAIQMNGKNHVFFSNRAACYFHQGNYSLALFDAERCIILNPSWFKGYLRKSAALLALRKYAEATAATEAGLKENPKHAELEEMLKSIKKQKESI
ncbi:ankyrin/TPRprotein [Angomonas deanei]|uniref:Ankyrin repeat/Ankyrin repeats (3 copies)/Ankyrin repeats (Many copies), putative n=1 Tax=Angomonas deanei TaxID=59799 RepID=A0A7G2CKQ1_9TRYP|nr:ankyrin/TPRprotein [Angomonas deanei]CAD2219975.1 Ankyrin repeat/Ankyrin repeats (3 copies)/Ankyrin repeats (many copies), putative [Angomonas deanei]|eukprot:EPY25017.1 ankyrin/TPRprotein [Angomonas deanei]